MTASAADCRSRTRLITAATDIDTPILDADLSITKTDGQATYTPGVGLTYTIVATNNGPSDVTDATVTDTFDAALGTVSWTASGTAGTSGFDAGPLATDINDTGITIPAGGSVTYTVVVAAVASDKTGNLVNTATVASAADTTPGNNTATDIDTPILDGDLSITKTDGVTTAIPGQTLTYTIVVSNNGPSGDPNATFADTFPAILTNITYTSVAAGGATGNTAAGAGNLNETLNLPAASSVTYTVSATIDPSATGTISNTATVTASITDPTPGNNSATDNDTVLTPQADLSITKTDGVTTAIPGQTLTYTIVVSNNGPSGDPNATFADTFPAILTNITYTSVAAGGATGNTAAGAGNLNETLNLPAASSVTYTVSATIDPSATGTISNTATVTASITDPTPGNNSATDNDTVLTPQADLAITKTDGVTTAIPGQTLTYTIVVSNNGPSGDPNATFADTFPAILTNITYTSVAAGGATGNTAAGAGNLNETLNLPAASSVTYTVFRDH